MDKQTETISKIEKTMRSWIEDNLEIYKSEPPAYEATSTQGELIKKANPATQEIRAAFKDYCYVVKTMRDLTGNEEVEVDGIEELRKKFKIAK
jgi:hypothetical protein